MKRVMLLLFVLSLLISMPVLAQAEDGLGAVYAMTNADEAHGGNQIVVYHRAANGLLTLVDTFNTGGFGATIQPNNALGASNPLILSPDHRWLFAVNAGSSEISVFKIDQDNLTLLQVITSNGEFPVSLTMHQKLLYVLNAGGEGNITGFNQGPDGFLTLLTGSTRSLNAGGVNPPDLLDSPAQVGFTPLGDKLVVTVKGVQIHEPKIHVFTVEGNGLLSAEPVTTDIQSVPFGFVFHHLDNLMVAEPFGHNIYPVEDNGAVSSYRIAADGSLVPISLSVPNGQTATCWIVISTNNRFAYTTNDPGTISSYYFGVTGRIDIKDDAAASTGDAPVDLAITPNNQYLYNVNAGNGTVSMFKIDQTNGNLIPLGEIGGLPYDGSAVGIAAR